MAIQSIHLGPVEDFLQFDDTEKYSDGITPKGLIVPIVPTTSNGVVRLADLTTATNPLIGLSFVVMALTGTLTSERKLTAGTGITLTDGGANGNATLAVKQQSTITSLTDNSGGTANDTVQALTDPADSPATADALRDDLVANLIPELRNDIADLAGKINAILTALKNAEIIST